MSEMVLGMGVREIILFPGADWLVKHNAVEQIIASQCDKCFDRGVIRCYSH